MARWHYKARKYGRGSGGIRLLKVWSNWYLLTPCLELLVMYVIASTVQHLSVNRCIIGTACTVSFYYPATLLSAACFPPHVKHAYSQLVYIICSLFKPAALVCPIYIQLVYISYLYIYRCSLSSWYDTSAIHCSNTPQLASQLASWYDSIDAHCLMCALMWSALYTHYYMYVQYLVMWFTVPTYVYLIVCELGGMWVPCLLCAQHVRLPVGRHCYSYIQA